MNFLFHTGYESPHSPHVPPADDVLNALFADGFAGIAFSLIHEEGTVNRPANAAKPDVSPQ
ncbi:hypothetical protein [Caballeronia sp. HLA56]